MSQVELVALLYCSFIVVAAGALVIWRLYRVTTHPIDQIEKLRTDTAHESRGIIAGTEHLCVLCGAEDVHPHVGKYLLCGDCCAIHGHFAHEREIYDWIVRIRQHSIWQSARLAAALEISKPAQQVTETTGEVRP